MEPEGANLEERRDSPSSGQDVCSPSSGQDVCSQTPKYEGCDKKRKRLSDHRKAQKTPMFSVEVEDNPKEVGLTISEFALRQFCQEKSAAFDMVHVRCYDMFSYANNFFYHVNFEARPHNPGDAEPSVKLFFAEVISSHPNYPVVTCCHLIEPSDKVTEGCIFCHRGSLTIHPISDVIKRDKRFSSGMEIRFGKFEDMARCLPGIPPYQLNRLGVVQSYNSVEGGHYLADEGVTGEMSLEEYLNFRKTRVQQLSEAVVEDLKKDKGVDLNLVEGLVFSTFKCREHTFHHLNFKAEPQGPQNELSIRLYFAEVINDKGACSVTFCCEVDPAEKVLRSCRFCYGRGVQQPDLSSMDLELGKKENVLYADLKLAQDLQIQNHGFRCLLPCMFPSCDV